jgi:hypothetical protein
MLEAKEESECKKELEEMAAKILDYEEKMLNNKDRVVRDCKIAKENLARREALIEYLKGDIFDNDRYENHVYGEYYRHSQLKKTSFDNRR